MKVFLIGMPGSGKSTVGKELAEHLQVRFVDLDNEIEAAAGKSITRLFAENGEDFFRSLESILLHQFAHTAERFVMATGGGAPCHHNGIDLINKSGLSIFLDVPVNALLQRLKDRKDRPMLNVDQQERERKLQALADTRIDCYRKAHIVVTEPSASEIAIMVRNTLASRKENQS